MMRAYLDSCIVIYLVEATGGLSQRVEGFLADADLVPCTSGIVRAECLVGPRKRGDTELLAAYTGFLGAQERLALTDAACDLAAEIRARSGLALPDALHLAIAESGGCDAFWTADKGFERAAAPLRVQVRLIA